MPATTFASRAGLTRFLFVCCVLASVFAACGIEYGSAGSETELFKSLTVDGELVTGGQVTIELSYEQPYPAAIRVLCALVAREGQDQEAAPSATNTPNPEVEPAPLSIPPPPPTPRHKVLDILDEGIPANTSITTNPATPVELLFEPGSSDNPLTPIPGTLREAFTAPEEPGLYAIACYTPVDANNAISKEFRIDRR
ncbi:MAG: hypothetical protein WEB04_00665 [Dehalococcoidia bacterium]